MLRDFGEIENLQVSPSSIPRFVTNTENKIESSLIEDLTKARPDWQFKAKTEEETSENKYYWIIDTLNGKTNFSHAFPYFSISIAVEYNNEIICTVIAKRCALIAVDEILNINSVDKDFSLSHYWLDVKHEIENL